MPQAHVCQVDGAKGVLLLAADDGDQEAIFRQYGVSSDDEATFAAEPLAKAE